MAWCSWHTFCGFSVRLARFLLALLLLEKTRPCGGQFYFSGATYPGGGAANYESDTVPAGKGYFTTITSPTVDAQFGGALSIAWIVNYAAIPSYSRIIDCGQGPGPGNNILSISNPPAPTTQLYVEQFGAGPSHICYFTSPTGMIEVGVLHTYLITLGPSGIKMWKDGTLVASDPTQTACATPAVTRSNCYIGQSNFPNDGLFQGTIGSLWIFNTELTWTQMQQRTYCSSSYPCPTNYLISPTASTTMGNSTALCCVPACSLYWCPSNYNPVANASFIAGSTTAVCCTLAGSDVACSKYSCGPGYQPKVNAATLLGSTTAECCDAVLFFSSPAYYSGTPSYANSPAFPYGTGLFTDISGAATNYLFGGDVSFVFTANWATSPAFTRIFDCSALPAGTNAVCITAVNSGSDQQLQPFLLAQPNAALTWELYATINGPATSHQYMVTMSGTGGATVFQEGTVLGQNLGYTAVPASTARTSCLIGRSNWADPALSLNVSSFFVMNSAISWATLLQQQVTSWPLTWANPSFELGCPAVDTYMELPGWSSFQGVVPLTPICIQTGNGNWGSVSAASGRFFAAMQGTGTAIYQVVPGHQQCGVYQLTFWATTRPGYPQAALQVTADGTTIFQQTLPLGGFVLYGAKYTASGSSVTIKFTNVATGSGDFTVFLDMISSVQIVQDNNCWGYQCDTALLPNAACIAGNSFTSCCVQTTTTSTSSTTSSSSTSTTSNTSTSTSSSTSTETSTTATSTETSTTTTTTTSTETSTTTTTTTSTETSTTTTTNTSSTTSSTSSTSTGTSTTTTTRTNTTTSTTFTSSTTTVPLSAMCNSTAQGVSWQVWPTSPAMPQQQLEAYAAASTSVDLTSFTVLLIDSSTGLQVSPGPGQLASAAVIGQFNASSSGLSKTAPSVNLTSNQLLWLTVLPGATQRGVSYCLRLQGIGATSWGSSSAVFTMDTGPYSGSVTVSPTRGQAAMTAFSLSTSWFASEAILPLSYIFFRRRDNSSDEWAALGDWALSRAISSYFAAGDWQVQASAKDVLGLEALNPALSDTISVTSQPMNASSALRYLIGLQALQEELGGSIGLDINPASAKNLPGFPLGTTTAIAQLFGVSTSSIGMTLTAARRLHEGYDSRRLTGISLGYNVAVPQGVPSSNLLASFATATPSSFESLLRSSLASAGVSVSVTVTSLPAPTARVVSNLAGILSGIEALVSTDSRVLRNSTVTNLVLDCLLQAGNVSEEGAKLQVGILNSVLGATNNALSATAASKATNILDGAVSAMGASSTGLNPQDAKAFVNVAVALLPPSQGANSSSSNDTSAAQSRSQRIGNIVEGVVAALTKSLVTSSSGCGSGFASSVEAAGLKLTSASVSPNDQAPGGMPLSSIPPSVVETATASAVPNPCGSKIGLGTSRWESNPYGPSAGGGPGRRLQQQNALGAIVSLSIAAPDGSEVPITGLVTPIAMVIPIQASTSYEDVEAALLTGSHPECRWWDKAALAWSTAGCRILGLDSGGTQLQCACTHLTPFGNFNGDFPIQQQASDFGNQLLSGLLAAFLCANVKIYTAEGFKVLQGMVWSDRPSAIVFAVLLGAFFIGFVAGTCLDTWNHGSHSWKKAEAKPEDKLHDDKDDDDVEDLDTMSFRQILRLIQKSCAELRQCKGLSLLRIYSSVEAKYLNSVVCWRLGVDMKTFKTLLAEEAHLKAKGDYDEIMAGVRTAKLLANVEAQAAAALQQADEAEDAQGPVRSKSQGDVKKEMSKLSTLSVSSGGLGKRLKLKQDVQGIPHHVAAALLASYPEAISESVEHTRQLLRSTRHSCSDLVDEYVERLIEDSEVLVVPLVCRGVQFLVKVLILAWADHPLRDIICTSVHLKHVGRTFLLVASQMMGATCSCIFFSATQGVGVDSPPECTPQTGVAAIVQTVVVQFVSIFVGVVCATWFLMLDENHRELSRSKVAVLKASLFYLSAFMLFVFFGYTVSSFIANTAEASTWQWTIALLVGLVQIFALAPLISGLQGALLWPIGSSLMVGIWHLRGAPINFQEPALSGDPEQPQDAPTSPESPERPRDEVLELPVELLDFYETLEVFEKAASLSRSWSEVVVPQESTPVDLPEHVQSYLKQHEVSPRQASPPRTQRSGKGQALAQRSSASRPGNAPCERMTV